MARTLINVAYCQEHWKGNKGINQLDGATHAEWLEQSVDYLREEVPWQLAISITGFSGICHIEAGRERDALWRLFDKTRFVTMSMNPSHQHGAAWCIRQGLEFAGKLGFGYMIHTAEDIVPFHGVLPRMVSMLDEGYEYVGEAWGIERWDLNSQFFAVRVQSLVPTFDPPAVSSSGFLERYLAHQMVGRSLGLIERVYHHTHDHQDWMRCLADERKKRGW